MKHPEILRLAQAAGKQYRGGITAVALLMETDERLLANKLNPNYDRNHLTLDEFAQLLEITHDSRALNALAALAERTTIALPDCCRSDKDLLAHCVELGSRYGEACREIQAACGSSSELGENLSANEKRRIGEVLDALSEAVFCLKRRIKE